MYFYKTFYTDGTWDAVKSPVPINTPADEHFTCYEIVPISILEYYSLQLRMDKILQDKIY